MGAEKTRKDANRDSSLNISIRLIANVIILEAIIFQLHTQAVLRGNER